MEMSNIKMSTIKDVIYIATVVIGVVFWFSNYSSDKAIVKNATETHTRQLKEINDKLNQQAELNGKILMYIEMDTKNTE